jgi:hypothetical protein
MNRAGSKPLVIDKGGSRFRRDFSILKRSTCSLAYECELKYTVATGWNVFTTNQFSAGNIFGVEKGQCGNSTGFNRFFDLLMN